MAAARGHFEAGPRSTQGWEGQPLGDFGWRFVDEDGRPRAVSLEGFASLAEAKRDAGDFVDAIRTSTYGLRFPESIADGVREVDSIEAP